MAGWITFLLIEASNQSRQLQDKRTATARKRRRYLARKKTIRNIEEQLAKPDFETRLKSYVTLKENEDHPDEFVSKMEYWERNESHESTPTRPIELLRSLLQRIAKLVGRS